MTSRGRRAASSRPGRLRDLENRLRRTPPDIPPALALLGPEPYFKAQALDTLREAIRKLHGTGGVERIVTGVDEMDLETVASVHLSASLFGTPKLVVVRRFEKAPIADRRMFLGILLGGRLPPVVTVVVVSEDSKLPAAGKDLPQYIFYPPYHREAVSWVRQRFRDNGIECDRDGAEALIEACGTRAPWQQEPEADFFRLAEEIARIAADVRLQGQTKVSAGGVLGRMAAGEAPDVFEVVRHLAAGRPGEVMAALTTLEQQGGRAEAVLGVLVPHMERLLYLAALREDICRGTGRQGWGPFGLVVRSLRGARSMRERRSLEGDLAGILEGYGTVGVEVQGIKSFLLPDLVIQATGYTADALKKLFSRTLEIDQKVKSGQGDAGTLLTSLAVEAARWRRRL